MKRYIVAVALIMVGFFILVYGVYLVAYTLAMKKSSDRISAVIKKNLFERSMTGTVYLNNRQYMNCYEYLEIISYPEKQAESISICPCNSKEFEQFVSDGDSIIKKSNTFTALFIKPDGTSREFELPLCK